MGMRQKRLDERKSSGRFLYLFKCLWIFLYFECIILRVEMNDFPAKGRTLPTTDKGNNMKRLKDVILIIWFSLISLSSPLWVGIIYMWITGHSKGYGYDLGSEADISVFLGCVFLLFWLLAILPATISLCKKCRCKKESLTWLPLLAFVGLFVAGICFLGWNEFIRLLGYGYPI